MRFFSTALLVAAASQLAAPALAAPVDDAVAVVRRSDVTMHARAGIAGEVVDDVAKAAETTVSSALKKGALSGLGTLLGGTFIGKLLGGGSDSNASTRAFDYDAELYKRYNLRGG
ncbi:hypothetical protein FA95DRAFT_1604819 [Auriscalpium vulgare]|uniref:Uncharacterized protein n=1 Tax=Auriscalpium vulgare TaxID=40419 RepID=A0ACB8RYS2_9AGAM|nr:hypothetical protein FA95DRAFT_1604819 [Auriscalpium vulgare]